MAGALDFAAGAAAPDAQVDPPRAAACQVRVGASTSTERFCFSHPGKQNRSLEVLALTRS